MLLPVFRDLVKPQWRVVLEALKVSGGLPVSELARKGDASYMAVKQHCEELKALGYLDRARVPRTVVGRPEIFYSLSSKADALFPEAGVSFTLELLDELKALYGESMPDKVLFQYFQKLGDRWTRELGKFDSFDKRIAAVVALRETEGYQSVLRKEEDRWEVEEYHNPLRRVLEAYPRGVTMELRILESLLGVRLSRREIPGGRSGQPKVIFEIIG